MAKEETENSDSQKPNYEHLRDEIFEVRVDYKSWIRSLKVITVSISIIIFILGYFGYTKIDSIENEVIERVNQRLAVTDSLISTIDQSRIDSLNNLIIQQEERYQQTIENLERIITTNEEIQKNLIEALPPNSRIEVPLSSYRTRSPDGMFTLGDIYRDFELYESINVGMIFEESVNLDEIKAIFLTITRSLSDLTRI